MSEQELLSDPLVQLGRFKQNTKWTAQTIHQAHHSGEGCEETFWTCPRNTCKAAADLLNSTNSPANRIERYYQGSKLEVGDPVVTKEAQNIILKVTEIAGGYARAEVVATGIVYQFEINDLYPVWHGEVWSEEINVARKKFAADELANMTPEQRARQLESERYNYEESQAEMMDQ